MSNTYNYRTATYDDIPAIRQLGLASYGQFQHQLPADGWAQMSASLNDEDNYAKIIHTGKGFLCFDGEKLAGMAYLVYQGNPWQFYPPEWSYLRMIGVDPLYAGKGIATKLTQMCIDEAKAVGENTIGLHTSELMTAARHIYESLGFKLQEELPVKFGMRYYLYKMEL